MRRLLISVAYLIIAVLILLPFTGIIFGSFQNGVGAFFEAIIRPEAIHALFVSLLIVCIVTAINTIVGVYLSIEIVRGTWIAQRMKPLLNAIVDVPFAISPIIVGLMIILIFGPNTAIGTFFEAHHMKIVYALPGMVLATLFITFPLMVREVVPLLEEIGTQAEQASATLGAGSFRTLTKITWPGIRMGVLYGIVLTVARSLGEFGSILVVSGNIINETQTATTLVYQDATNFDLVSANSVALLLGLVSITVLLLLERIKRRKEAKLHAH